VRIALLYLIVYRSQAHGWPGSRGKENCATFVALVFVCNHTSIADHALILLALPEGSAEGFNCHGRRAAARLAPPTIGTGLFTRLLSLFKYVAVVLFFNVFSMPQKSGFRRSFMLPVK